MSLGRLLLEEGLDIELKADIREVIELLDGEIPKFVCDGYGYRISSSMGVASSKWRLMVKPWDLASSTELEPAVGFIEVDKMEGGSVDFRIPPRDQWCDAEARAFDEDGKLFSSFIFQLLTAFQVRGFVDFPGRLPVF